MPRQSAFLLFRIIIKKKHTSVAQKSQVIAVTLKSVFMFEVSYFSRRIKFVMLGVWLDI